MASTTVGDVVDLLERRYPPGTAEDWDVVGLAVGERSAPVRRVLLSVDVLPEVIAEAVELGAELVVAHHPMLLRGITSVVGDQPKGRLVMSAVRAGIAVHTAHTNADVARDGVSAALARTLGLQRVRPLLADGIEPGTGVGRIGQLPEPMTAGSWIDHVADALAPTAGGVRLAGDPQRWLETVAVVGGAGDGYLEAVRAAGVDAYLTSDLRHHPVSEHLQHAGAPVLVDVAHAAAEASWLPLLAEVLRVGLGSSGPDVVVSRTRTDPWTARAG